MGETSSPQARARSRRAGRVVDLVEPELVTDPELRPAPWIVRFLERRVAGVTQYLRMHAAPSDPPAVE